MASQTPFVKLTFEVDGQPQLEPEIQLAIEIDGKSFETKVAKGGFVVPEARGITGKRCEGSSDALSLVTGFRSPSPSTTSYFELAARLANLSK